MTATAAALIAAVLAGCGGSGSPTVSETSGSPSVTPAATLPAGGGLVGDIDAARKVAVCTNVQAYETAVAGGLTSSAREAFRAILATLREAPRDPALLALAAHWQLARRHVGDDATAERLTAFCAANP